MSDLFVGTDIVPVARIANLLHSPLKPRFIERTFTANEIAYCERKATPAIHFAGRFAAKEALKKALLSSRLLNQIAMSAMEIIPLQNGCPKVIIHKEIDKVYQCKVSISHSEETAIAFALLIIDK